MRKYAMWDKVSDIFTLVPDQNGKQQWTAQEYIDTHAQWAAIPGVKVIIGGGHINGTAFMEFDVTVDFYKRQGADITDDMTDEEVLLAIEEFEDRPPVSETDGLPSPEERIAAALEFNNLLQM